MFNLLLSFSLSAIMLTGGFLYLRTYERRNHEQIVRELSSIADLKVAEIEQWRSARLGDMDLVSSGINAMFINDENPRVELYGSARKTILSRFKTICSAYHYDKVFFLDASGGTILRYPGVGPGDSILEGAAPEVLRSGSIEFHDFYICAEDGHVYLAVLAPVGKSAVLAFRIDPTVFLYPFLARWPTDRSTAETLIVRRDMDRVVFLNPLKYGTDPALSIRLSLSMWPDLPAVRAVLGEQGVYEGLDYRGVTVLSVLRAIPDSPWFLVARMDQREVEAATIGGRIVFSLLILVLLMMEIIGFSAISRRQKVENYRKDAIISKALYESEEHLREALETSNQELEKRVAERNVQLITANQKLETSNKELEAFAYSVAHDLRAPLRAVDGFSRILEEDHAKVLNGEGLRLLGIVRGNVKSMDRLITEILELARLGRAALRFRRVDMAKMALDVFRKVTDPEVARSFEMEVGPLPEVEADASMIERVWSNLLSNAVKYSIPSPVHRIDVEGREEKGIAIFTVRDRGVGFDPRYKDRLFKLFQRLHDSGTFEGAGVGLAIVAKIISRHRGDIWAEGSLGEGARVTFTIPIERGE